MVDIIIDIDDDSEEEYYSEWDKSGPTLLELGIRLGILNEDGTYVERKWRTRKIEPKNQQ